jgi:hypothetical protein
MMMSDDQTFKNIVCASLGFITAFSGVSMMCLLHMVGK